MKRVLIDAVALAIILFCVFAGALLAGLFAQGWFGLDRFQTGLVVGIAHFVLPGFVVWAVKTDPAA